ncbi:MAG: Hsp20/alpha crystallin family protein [Candidatus Caldarchaeum sp.]|nr:Hsp20/alpha crystallin family protein [Candidatus Caldarchaeum sp.]
MDRSSDWDEFFTRLGREIENRVRDVLDQSIQAFEPFVGEYRRPRVDMTVTPTHVYLVLEMPGCAKETIDLRADESTITITADYMTPSQEYSRLYPFGHGRGYRRTISLPRSIDPSKIEAKYESGILFLKAEIARPKGVKIQID